MHDPTSQGTDFFRCDFCRQAWSESRPMVEGHRGSLICSSCLLVAYAEIVLERGGVGAASLAADGGASVQPTCRMCLETRDERHWRSPMFPEAICCARCVRQSAATLEHDPDSNWKRPARPGGEAEDTQRTG